MKIEKNVVETIEKNPIALATSTRLGTPNVSVAAFVKVKYDKIVITNNYMGKTIANVNQNPHVSLVVWNDKWKGYQIHGKAEYHEKGKWCDFVKSIKENKSEPCKGVIVIIPESIKQIG